VSGAELVVFGSISCSVGCWAAGEAIRSRTAWLAGALLALVHAIAAFGVFYQWSHATAERLTALQAAQLTGVSFSGGIYVNYAFVAIWLIDAVWWSARPASYERRPRALSLAIRLFLFAIVVSGAIVFADGMARMVGAAAVAWVVIMRIRHARR
jgi:hypothetical protein